MNFSYYLLKKWENWSLWGICWLFSSIVTVRRMFIEEETLTIDYWDAIWTWCVVFLSLCYSLSVCCFSLDILKAFLKWSARFLIFWVWRKDRWQNWRYIDPLLTNSDLNYWKSIILTLIRVPPQLLITRIKMHSTKANKH